MATSFWRNDEVIIQSCVCWEDIVRYSFLKYALLIIALNFKRIATWEIIEAN